MHFSALLILGASLAASAAPDEAITNTALDNSRHGLTYCGDGLLRKVLNKRPTKTISIIRPFGVEAMMMCRLRDTVGLGGVLMGEWAE
ncbi:uncharacterized protein RCO7_15271 [Rhynchosporium graminicola]|uniref:Uncharacterized protein n=1 Tax=Rhynchosporium graminicola TaxID=2792576 RepID=A0A1E1LTQ1_9HELO|nr:uncharacterized protein RCO7_15271 [Rhynchosporium commune]